MSKKDIQPYEYLLKRFIIFSTVSAISILILVSFGVYNILKNYVIKHAENDAAIVSSILSTQERDTLLSTGQEGEIKVFVEEKNFLGLNKRMKGYLKPLEIIKIKIFSKDEEIVYSTDNAIIGKIDKNNLKLKMALQGNIVSKIETKEKVWDIEGEARTDMDLVETYYPIKDKYNNVIGSFEIYADVTSYRLEIRQLMILAAGIISVVLFFVFLALFMLMKRATKALGIMYAELERKKEELIQAEKFNAIGRLASGVAHEIKNPLGIIKQSAEFLKNKLPVSDKDAPEVLKLIQDNILRADGIINVLLDSSQASKLEKKPENMNSLLEASLTLIQYNPMLEKIKIIRELSPGLPNVWVDKGKMEQVFINIFLNAIQAMPKGGSLFLRTYQSKLGRLDEGMNISVEDNFKLGDDLLFIEIEDTGEGIDQDDLKKIFEPFFTTKVPGQGTGLGLSVSKNILKMHKGLIQIQSKKGQGTKVIITLKIGEGGKSG